MRGLRAKMTFNKLFSVLISFSNNCDKFHAVSTTSLIKRAYSIDYYNINETVHALKNITNNSTISIGGYMTHGVPNNLLSGLANVNCSNLTLITNASISMNHNLDRLMKINGKVRKLITSIEDNKSLLSDVDFRKRLDVDFLDSKTFLQRYCYGSLFTCDPNTKFEYSLVKAPSIDENGDLVWCFGEKSYYNVNFAKLSTINTIAEVSDTIEVAKENKFAIRVSQMYLNKVVFCQAEDSSDLDNSENINKSLNYSLLNDLQVQAIIKRLLDEIQNGDNIYISNCFANLIEYFYMPKHLDVNVLNSYINNLYPHNIEWLFCVNKLSLCVIEITQINPLGEAILANTTKMRDIEVINNSRGKLIAVMTLKKNSITNERFYDCPLKRKIDLIITDRGAFRIDKENNRIKMVDSHHKIEIINEFFNC